jgi:lipopolysaccharide exporter
MRAALLFALFAQPTVQLIRFLSKAVLVWFLVADEFGEATFAGLLINLALIAAVLGLDEAVISTPRLGAVLWHKLRRLHHMTGIVMALVVALAGHIVGALLDYPTLPLLTTVLAPSVWLANMAVLPTALLVRQREYRRVFFIDLWSVLALSVTMVGLAAAGAGPWSLVGGWYANALVSVVAANIQSRPFHPSPDTPEDPLAPTLRYGLHIAGAELTTFGSERVDLLVVSGLGAAAFALYGWAQHMSLFVSNYTASISERILFPVLAERGRSGSLTSAARESLRLAVILVVPAHVLLGMTARPLVTGYLPAAWHAAAAPLLLLALAAGARSLDMVGLSILKAAGRSQMVLGLGILRIGLVTAGALLMIGDGIVGVALGVLLARSLAATLVLVLAGNSVPSSDDETSGVFRALLSVGVWCALFVPLVEWAPVSGPLAILSFQVCTALAIWLAVRLVLDSADFRRDRSTVTRWLATKSEH